MSKVDQLKSFDEIMEMPHRERSDYFHQYFYELHEQLDEKESQRILSSLFDHPIYQNDNTEWKKVPPEEEYKNLFWHLNHKGIEGFLHKAIHDTGKLPGISHISCSTTLSNSIVELHLNSYQSHKGRKLELQKLKISQDHLMTFLLQLAYRQDLKAADLFLKYSNKINQPDPSIKSEIAFPCDEDILELQPITNVQKEKAAQ